MAEAARVLRDALARFVALVRRNGRQREMFTLPGVQILDGFPQEYHACQPKHADREKKEIGIRAVPKKITFPMGTADESDQNCRDAGDQ